MKPIYLIILAVLLASCGSNSLVDQKYDPVYKTTFKSIPKEQVSVLRYNHTNQKNLQKWIVQKQNKGLVWFGDSIFEYTGANPSDEQIRSLAARKGADFAYYDLKSAGTTTIRKRVPMGGTADTVQYNPSYTGGYGTVSYVPGITVYGYKDVVVGQKICAVYLFKKRSTMTDRETDKLFAEVEKKREALKY